MYIYHTLLTICIAPVRIMYTYTYNIYTFMYVYPFAMYAQYVIYSILC